MPLGGVEMEVASDSSSRAWEASQREGLRGKGEPGTCLLAKKEPGERSRLEAQSIGMRSIREDQLDGGQEKRVEQGRMGEEEGEKI